MTWSEAFTAYLDELGIPNQQAAQELRISPSLVHYWRRGATPREAIRRRVARWSKGRVPHELHVKAAS